MPDHKTFRRRNVAGDSAERHILSRRRCSSPSAPASGRIFDNVHDDSKVPRMKKFPLADGPTVFGHLFYTTAMLYDRREQAPFPPVNIYCCRNKVLVQALLPGMDLDAVHITLDNDCLILEGCMLRRKGHYLHEERYSGRFRRSVVLGTPVLPHAEVSLRNGILQIELQRRT